MSEISQGYFLTASQENGKKFKKTGNIQVPWYKYQKDRKGKLAIV